MGEVIEIYGESIAITKSASRIFQEMADAYDVDKLTIAKIWGYYFEANRTLPDIWDRKPSVKKCSPQNFKKDFESLLSFLTPEQIEFLAEDLLLEMGNNASSVFKIREAIKNSNILELDSSFYSDDYIVE